MIREDILFWLRNGFYRTWIKDDTINVNKLVIYTMEVFKVSRNDVWDNLNALRDSGVIELYYWKEPTAQIWGWYKGNPKEMDNTL